MIDVREVATYVVALAAREKLQAQWSIAAFSPTHDDHRWVHFRCRYVGDETEPARRVEATRAALAAIESALAPLRDCVSVEPSKSPTHVEGGEPRPDIRAWFVLLVWIRGPREKYAEAAWQRRPPLDGPAG
ncbi:hypothetical protein SAMN02745121_02791 [Nannocystis exedens]|uniref:Uncharacterized protein n=1 Tax=Nannocystis exedens TaxID=54 RepID=A0A1I1X8L1_9BACT|nr:hypothetical protein [Nannocystis exedens]PCC70741.1 hypothetical protein NAEX_03805 [Nannocystis exedens]SFE03756.1 hypothetical protein SAMN02745121_02791 [Nannocystis exedens]